MSDKKDSRYEMAGVEFRGMFEDFLASKDEYEEAFYESGLEGVVEKAKKSLTVWNTTPLFIGVTGSSGAGKSTFINTIRGLEPDDDGAADTGVTETTVTTKLYPHPNNSMLQFVDMPGVGTPNFKIENYCEKVEFDKFDMFIIITHKRFTQNDVWLCKEIQKRKKHFIFVRSQVEQDLENEKRRRKIVYEKNEEKNRKGRNTSNWFDLRLCRIWKMKKGEREENIRSMERYIIEKIRIKTNDGLKKEFGREIDEDQLEVFLIDSLRPNHPLLDFPMFSKKLIDDFPENKKKALILTLSHLTPAVIDQKENVLKQEIWKKSLASAVGNLMMVPGASFLIDAYIAENAAKDYRRQFGLETNALQKIAKSINVSTEELFTSADLTTVGFELTRTSVLRLCSELLKQETVVGIKLNNLFEVFGRIISGKESFKETSLSLGKLLAATANDARKVQVYVKERLLFMADRPASHL